MESNDLKTAVGLIFSDGYRHLVCSSPKFCDRFSMVMDLINAYDLGNKLVCVPPLAVSTIDSIMEELTIFHTEDYVNALRTLQRFHQNHPNESERDESAFESFGLSYDCPGFPQVFAYALACVLGSLAACDALLRKECQVAINWAGGWHHAKRSEASGFCYLNDVVLAIHRLQTGFRRANPTSATRVLYVDLDLHHGDGVEDAFWYSPSVVTFSVHHASPGFFPGSGTWLQNVNDPNVASIPNGAGRGRFSAFNLPLAEGADDLTWSNAVLPALNLLHAAVRPSVIVVQCGADGLADDPHRVFNLTNAIPAGLQLVDSMDDIHDEFTAQSDVGSYVSAIKLVLSWKLPTLLLGGGGYNFPSTAKLWTVLTALSIASVSNSELKLSSDIPEHSYLSCYGPDFGLNISSVPRINRTCEKDVYLHHTRLTEQACRYAELNQLPCDPTELARVIQQPVLWTL